MCEIETETKVIMAVVVLISAVLLSLIGSVTYYNRSVALDKFKTEQNQYELLRDGKPTKLEVVVHKLDDAQFEKLIQAIKEKP